MVADPAVCHGRPTFCGTRIFMSDVLDDVARGLAWEAIIERWHGSISKDTIAEAVRLAREALLNHSHKLVPELPKWRLRLVVRRPRANQAGGCEAIGCHRRAGRYWRDLAFDSNPTSGKLACPIRTRSIASGSCMAVVMV